MKVPTTGALHALDKLDTIIEKVTELEGRIDELIKLAGHALDPVDELLTVEEAAAIYKLAKGTLYHWKHVQVKIAGSVRISRKAMDKLIERPGKLK